MKKKNPARLKDIRLILREFYFGLFVGLLYVIRSTFCISLVKLVPDGQCALPDAWYFVTCILVIAALGLGRIAWERRKELQEPAL